MGLLEFTKICHLGEEGEQDQRLAADQHGNYYLYDWSGDGPDKTDDGPLKMVMNEPIEIDLESCTVRVLRAGTSRMSYVGVTHAGTIKLLDTLRLRGAKEVPTLLVARAAQPLVRLAAHALLSNFR